MPEIITTTKEVTEHDWRLFRQVWRCTKCNALYFRDRRGFWWNDAGPGAWVPAPAGKDLPDCCAKVVLFWPNKVECPNMHHEDVVILIERCEAEQNRMLL